MGWHWYWKSWDKCEHLARSTWRLTQFILLIGTVLPLVLVIWKPHAGSPPETRTAPAISVVRPASHEIPLADAGTGLRPLLPYSVIPGGAADAGELRSAIAHDPVVATHYTAFDLSKTHVVRLDRSRAFYVSYRLADRVYWTKKTLMLFKGETVLTDGEHLARTRCGNRLSETAESPTSSKEPERDGLETPAAPELTATADPVPELSFSPIGSLVSPSEEASNRDFVVPPIVPVLWGSGPSDGPGSALVPPVVPPDTATPEPGTLLLLSAGLLTGWAFKRKDRKSKIGEN